MNERDYKKKLLPLLQNIFGNNFVEKEWDSYKYDTHFSNHKEVYGPRHDVAIKPFNSYGDLDCGVDNTKSMQNHRLIKVLIKDKLEAGCKIKDVWNSFSRCFIGIEIEFSGSSKHILGSLINASVSGSIGIVIGNKDNLKKIQRIYDYLFRLESLERPYLKTIGNLFIF